jgi:hypothetical protein
MGTAKLAQFISSAPLPRASKAELGRKVREMTLKSTDNSRRAAPSARTGATLHAESLQAGLVRKLSDEEWLAQ